MLFPIWASLAASQNVWTVFSVDSENQFNLDAYLGTPPQLLTVSLDLGTADLFVVPNRCTDSYCYGLERGAAFNLSYSESLFLNKSFFTTELLAGTQVSGFWANDVLQIGGHAQNGSIFAVRADTNNQFLASSNLTTSLKVRSTLGLGPRGMQSSVLWTENGHLLPVYKNFMYGLSNVSASFSLWVDPEQLQQGLLLFGGMDPALFVPGTYGSLPITTAQDKLGDWLLEPSFLGFEYYSLQFAYVPPGSAINPNLGPALITLAQGPITNTDTNVSLTAILNSQSSLRLTAEMMQNLMTQIDASYSYYADSYVAPCASTGVFLLNAANYTLEFPLSDYLVALNLTDAAGNEVCSLDVAVSDSLVLPNAALKYYFVAVDYDASLISFARPARAVPGAAPQQIVPISSLNGSAPISFVFPTTTAPMASYNSQMSSSYQLTGADSLTAAATSYQI